MYSISFGVHVVGKPESKSVIINRFTVFIEIKFRLDGFTMSLKLEFIISKVYITISCLSFELCVIYRNPFLFTNTFQTNSQAKSINKQTNKTPKTYISKAGCCLDDRRDQN